MFRRKKKVIRETKLVINISELTFLMALNKEVKDFQDSGYEVEVQYCDPYHALILAYEVK